MIGILQGKALTCQEEATAQFGMEKQSVFVISDMTASVQVPRVIVQLGICLKINWSVHVFLFDLELYFHFKNTKKKPTNKNSTIFVQGLLSCLSFFIFYLYSQFVKLHSLVK